MHGLGNDFVILDGRSEAVTMTPELARALADRQFGIGCDQLILLEPSTVADVKITERLATALFYGIKTDTLHLERGGTRADMEAFPSPGKRWSQ